MISDAEFVSRSATLYIWLRCIFPKLRDSVLCMCACVYVVCSLYGDLLFTTYRTYKKQRLLSVNKLQMWVSCGYVGDLCSFITFETSEQIC